jgi:hypothetical protein
MFKIDVHDEAVPHCFKGLHGHWQPWLVKHINGQSDMTVVVPQPFLEMTAA